MVDQILHRKLIIEQYNSTKNRDELSSPEWQVVLAPLVTPVLVL